VTAVRLIPLAAEHLPAVPPMLDDPAVAAYTPLPSPAPDDWAEPWLARNLQARAEGTREVFAAFDADDRLVGLGFAPHIDADSAEIELGYLIAPSERGRGLGTAVLRALTGWAFDSRGAYRLTLLIDADNLASQKVAERSGYSCEGTLRALHAGRGRRRDTQLWSRLVTDPPA